MAQVSRRPLSKQIELQMHSALRRALAGIKTEEGIGYFLDDLLTPTEKMMLGKRLAIAILLDKGYDQRTIHSIMSVSVTTVNSVNYWYKHQGRGYRAVINKLKTDSDWEDIKHEIEKSLKEFFSTRRPLIPNMPFHDKPQKTLL